MNKVICVVVTYNRKKLLIECLQAVFSQTFPITKVILIDNASTDGTEEYLKQNKFLDNPLLQYKKMPFNTGGSGGFYEGIQEACNLEYDWLWLMDDDTIPQADCLEKLLKAEGFLDQCREKVSYLASAVFGPEGEFMNVPIISQKKSDNGYAYWYKYLNHNMVAIQAATFVSVLVNHKAVARCGLPCKDFFIWGDDGEYTMRLVKYYGDAWLVGDSVVVHKRVGARELSLKNETDPNRIKMFHYYYRNNAIRARYYGDNNRPFLYALKSIKGSLTMLRTPFGYEKMKVVIKGNLEGLVQYRKYRTFIDRELESR